MDGCDWAHTIVGSSTGNVSPADLVGLYGRSFQPNGRIRVVTDDQRRKNLTVTRLSRYSGAISASVAFPYEYRVGSGAATVASCDDRGYPCLRPNRDRQERPTFYKQQFLARVQKRLAGAAIGPSTLRNQGAAGVAQATRDCLGNLNLRPLRRIRWRRYAEMLDRWTEQLRGEFPDGAQNWGTAGKAMNVFLVEVFFNRFLSRKCRMSRLADVLETPLDSQTGKRIEGFASNSRLRLPNWPGLVNLTSEVSRQYQEVASRMVVGSPRDIEDHPMHHLEHHISE